MGRGWEIASRSVKAVPPILAAILLMAITLVAVVVLYVYIQEQVPPPAEEPLSRLGRLDARVEVVIPTYYRAKNITIVNNVAQNLSDYSVRIELNLTTFNDWPSVTPGNIAVVENTTGIISPLPYWFEEFNVTAQKAILWVKVPHIPALGTITIYLMYNNTNPYNTYHDPHKVFLFYEDAEQGGVGLDWIGAITYDPDGNGLGRVFHDPACAYRGVLGLNKTEDNDPNGAYKPLPSPVGIANTGLYLEAWLYRPWPPPTPTAGTVDRIGLIDDSGNGYGWGYWHQAAQLVFDKRVSYNNVSTFSPNPPDIVNEWYRGVLKILPGGTIVVERYNKTGDLMGSLSVSDTTYTSFTNVYVFGGYNYCVDQIILRKYVDPEPTILLPPPVGNMSFIRLRIYNTGAEPLDLSHIYLWDLETDALLAEYPLSQSLPPGRQTTLDVGLNQTHSGFLRVKIATKQGLSLEEVVSMRKTG